MTEPKYINTKEFWNRLISVSENDWVGFDTIDEVLSGMPSEQRWIPCSERMPEKSGTYLASTNMGDVGLAECDWDYEDGMYWSAEYLDVDAIVAWMELPEPYKEKNDE